MGFIVDLSEWSKNTLFSGLGSSISIFALALVLFFTVPFFLTRDDTRDL